MKGNAALADFPGVNTIHRKLADGSVRTHRYHRKSKRRLMAEPGTEAFALEYAAAERGDRVRRGRAVSPYRRERVEVYFVQGETTGHVKIGWAKSAARRLQNLQVGSPDKLRLLGVLVDIGGGRREAEVHAQFGHLRLHGEWFRGEPELLDFIAAIGGPGPSPSTYQGEETR